MTDLYQELLLDAARHPQHFGQLADATWTVSERNASCGDQINISCQADSSGRRVQQLKWQGQGCILSQAAAEVLVGQLLHTRPEIASWSTLTLADIQGWLNLPDVSPGRLKCLGIALAAAKQIAQLQASANQESHDH